jgi:hypothetical protein
VRAARKRGLDVRAIDDPSIAPRLLELSQQAFERTHGPRELKPWRGIIERSGAQPDRSRVIGLFDPRVSGPASLVAFAWGAVHGSYASYEAAGSTRRADLGSTPLGYAPLWELIRWARDETSATWFDLGGVGSDTPSDSRVGISRFKRYFSKHVVVVGREWQLEPHRVRGAVARAIGAAASWVRR